MALIQNGSCCITNSFILSQAVHLDTLEHFAERGMTQQAVVLYHEM